MRYLIFVVLSWRRSIYESFCFEQVVGKLLGVALSCKSSSCHDEAVACDPQLPPVDVMGVKVQDSRARTINAERHFDNFACRCKTQINAVV